MVMWIRTYDVALDLWQYFEGDEEGWVLRQVDLRGDDGTPVTAASLEEVLRYQERADIATMSRYEQRYGLVAEGRLMGWEEAPRGRRDLGRGIREGLAGRPADPGCHGPAPGQGRMTAAPCRSRCQEWTPESSFAGLHSRAGIIWIRGTPPVDRRGAAESFLLRELPGALGGTEPLDAAALGDAEVGE